MAPDSLALVWVTIAAALLSAVATAFLWDRVGRVWAWLFRPVAIAVCLATAMLSAAAVVNHQNVLFATWTEVLGRPAPVDVGPVPADAPTPTHGGASTGRVVSFTVHGRASGLTLPAYAYLPPGYDSAALRGQRLPVIEAFDGYPGSPLTWFKALQAPRYLDREIENGRMAPTVVVFPYQTTNPRHDSECVDAVGGAAMDTFLTVDVPAAVTHSFRVRTDAAGWGTIGYSEGAYCAVNLAMRHPDRYTAAASLSGYFEPWTNSQTGNLFGTGPTAWNLNSPLWRVLHLPVPRLSLYLASASDDHDVYSGEQKFLAAVRPPLSVEVATLPVGGHSRGVWQQLQGPAYDWLSAHLAGPSRTAQISLNGLGPAH